MKDWEVSDVGEEWQCLEKAVALCRAGVWDETGWRWCEEDSGVIRLV